MQTKLFEVRDEGTFIPVLATKISGSDSPLLRHAGYRDSYVILTNLVTCLSFYDPHAWSFSRTLREAHLYIEKQFDELPNEAVVDVQYILGETPQPKGPMLCGSTTS
jgi:hypothetical protein